MRGGWAVLAQISISGAVNVVIVLIVAGVIFGLLFFLVDYCTRQFPSVAPFAGVAKIILMILAVLVLIGILLSLLGYQVFKP